MKVVPKLITQSELATALGIGNEAIRKLRRENLPATKQKNRLMFSPQSVFEWCVSTGRHKHATRLAGAFPDSITVETPTPVKMDGDIADLDKYVERVRFNECALHEIVTGCKGDRNALIWAIGNYKDACKQRLDVEREISRIKLDQSKSISREEANRQAAEMGQIVQNRLMCLPGTLAAELVGKKASEINDILTKEFHAVLEELSK